MKVELQKVYSHYNLKIKKAKEEDREMIERMENNLEEIKENWGHEQWVLNGNDGADRLANIGRKKKQDKSWIGGTGMQVVDEEGVNVGGRSIVIEKIKKWQKGWKKQAAERYDKGDIRGTMKIVEELEENEFEMRVRKSEEWNTPS